MQLLVCLEAWRYRAAVPAPAYSACNTSSSRRCARGGRLLFPSKRPLGVRAAPPELNQRDRLPVLVGKGPGGKGENGRS
jgi:hypothetical protein